MMTETELAAPTPDPTAEQLRWREILSALDADPDGPRKQAEFERWFFSSSRLCKKCVFHMATDVGRMLCDKCYAKRRAYHARKKAAMQAENRRQPV